RRQVAGLAVAVFFLAILGVLALGALVERLERRNRDLAARFRAVFDSSDLGMAMVDGEGVITEDNHALRGITGVPDLSGHRLVELLSPPDARLVGRWMDEIRDGTRDTIHGEVKAVRRSDDDGWWHLTLSGTREARGEPGLALAILEDVTDRRQLEAQLVQAQKMEAIGRLAGGVAHDFNNLLTTINGTASMALADLDDRSPVKGDLGEILKAGQRAASLTSQLLAFSRRQMMRQKVVDLNAVIADTATMLRRMIGEDVRLHLELSHSVPPVLVDPGQIGQVLMNLAVNARDAMPGGGDVWIETDSLEVGRALSARLGTSRAGRHAILRVRDNGQGMDETTRSMVFEPFFTTKPVGKGTGLGLPMVYGIVKQSSGGIAVESAPGAGTTFTIALPERIESPPGEDAEGVREEVTLTTGSGTVLLVEDEDGVRSLVSRVLRRAGYRVLEADGSEAAIKVASRHEGPLDALVTDVVMPDMGGPELARALTSMRPSLRVLFISGYTKSEVLPSEELDGGVAFLAKPMAPADLARTLATLLE
ncbi:MAG TPA: ATP-binding protein, partial [Longimicrobiales bacterium]|nr:ATP-binding protein [Longimicrobiales bacterium]